jgi:hypothetical protein
MKTVIIALQYLAVLANIFLGIFLLLSQSINLFTPAIKNILGVIFIFYGIFRAYQIYIKRKQDENN